MSVEEPGIQWSSLCDEAEKVLLNYRVGSQPGLTLDDDANGIDIVRCAAHKHLYSLGFTKSRVTIASQQLRAENLALSLAAVLRQELPRHQTPEVLVVGSGIAGFTLAVHMARVGVNVHLATRGTHHFGPLNGNSNRDLRPYISEWPFFVESTPWPNSTAALSAFPWAGGSQRAILRDWQQHCKKVVEAGLLSFIDVTDRRWELDCQKDHIEFKTGVLSKGLDAAVLAIGHGREDYSDFPVNLKTYWDDLPYPTKTSGPTELPCLVAGRGDGAILEILEFSQTKSLKWDWLIKLVAREEYERPEFGEYARWIEEQAADGADWSDIQLDNLYRGILSVPNDFGKQRGDRNPLIIDRLLKELYDNRLDSASLRPVMLVRDLGKLYSYKAAPINRLLLLHLQLVDAFTPIDGYSRADLVNMTRRASRSSGLEVDLKVDGKDVTFPNMVVRHGTGASSADPNRQSFPGIVNLDTVAAALIHIDGQTRDFAPERRPAPYNAQIRSALN